MPVGTWSKGGTDLCIRENGVGWLIHGGRCRPFWMSSPTAKVCTGRWMHSLAQGGDTSAYNDIGSIVVRADGNSVAVSAIEDGTGVQFINTKLGECQKLPVPVLVTVAAAYVLGLVRVIQADVSDPEACQEAIDIVGREWGRLDVLVNMASLYERVAFDELDADEWSRQLSVDLDGSFFCATAAVPLMQGRRSPNNIIINDC